MFNKKIFETDYIHPNAVLKTQTKITFIILSNYSQQNILKYFSVYSNGFRQKFSFIEYKGSYRKDDQRRKAEVFIGYRLEHYSMF